MLVSGKSARPSFGNLPCEHKGAQRFSFGTKSRPQSRDELSNKRRNSLESAPNKLGLNNNNFDRQYNIKDLARFSKIPKAQQINADLPQFTNGNFSSSLTDAAERSRAYMGWLNRQISTKGSSNNWMTGIGGKGMHRTVAHLMNHNNPQVSLYSTTTPRKPSRRNQRWLCKVTKDLFPESEICEDYTHPVMKFPSGKPLQFDAFIPDKLLALEYQGEQHYETEQFFGSHKVQQKRDEEKRLECEKNQITLIEIPYWWDGKEQSLRATIHKERPDIIARGAGRPIPTERLVKQIPNLLLADTWTTAMDPTGWWMSEKYDGVRMYWNGEKFITRYGTEIAAASSLVASMPPFALDGEICLNGENTFGRLFGDWTSISRIMKKGWDM